MNDLALSIERAESVLHELALQFKPAAAETRERAAIVPAAMDEGGSSPAEPRQSAEARYRSLVERLPAVTFMAALDAGKNSLYVSPQIETLLGFTQRQWLDDPVLWHRQLHPDDRDRWHSEFALDVRNREAFPLGIPVPVA